MARKLAKKRKKIGHARGSLRMKSRKKIAKKRTTARKKSTKKVSVIPKGYHSITPYLIAQNAAQAINFYKKAFGAKEVMRMEQNGKIMHAELIIGDAKIMLADEHPEMDARSPHSFGGSPVGIHLYIKNVDSIVDKATANGAKVIQPVETMFYGDRMGTLEDPFGHKWHVSTHVEDVTKSNMKKRANEIFSKSWESKI